MVDKVKRAILEGHLTSVGLYFVSAISSILGKALGIVFTIYYPSLVDIYIEKAKKGAVVYIGSPMNIRTSIFNDELSPPCLD